MEKGITRIFKWLRNGNRYVYLLGGIAIGAGADDWYCSLYAGIGIASALELKDKTLDGKWEWSDWCLLVTGAVVGQLIRIAL